MTENMKKQRGRRIAAIILVCVSTPFAVFYLFVFPVLVANHTFPPNVFGIAFGLFLYAQLWIVVAEYAYSAVAGLYGLKRRALLLRLREVSYRLSDSLIADEQANKREFGRAETLFVAFSSYFLTVYAFTIAYVFVSYAQPASFNVGRLDAIPAAYFSLVTIATVGYGDIAPISNLARLLTMGEIITGLIYVTFFFSIIAGFIRDKNT